MRSIVKTIRTLVGRFVQLDEHRDLVRLDIGDEINEVGIGET